MSFKYECAFGKEGVNSENVKTANSLWTRTISPEATSVKLTNTSKGVLYAGFTSRSAAGCGERLKAFASGISVSVAYRDLDGNAINPSSLAQGTDFTAEVTVSDISGGTACRNLALTVGIPSGWEIFNSRLFGGEENSAAAYSHCDVRDNGVVYYFDLSKASSKTFSIRLSAAYPGVFVLPSVSCEAMYDNSVAAGTASSTVRVSSPQLSAK